MTYLNKRRSADENIGKLIMFSVTIIIAVGLVGLITFFYNQSRVQSVNMSILASTASSATDLQNVKNSAGDDLSATAYQNCDPTGITYNPVTNKYTLVGSLNATAANATECNTFMGLVKGITVSSAASTTADLTYTIN